MINHITLALSQPEYSALLDMAVAELLSSKDELRCVPQQGLEHRSLTPHSAKIAGEECTPADVLRRLIWEAAKELKSQFLSVPGAGMEEMHHD